MLNIENATDRLFWRLFFIALAISVLVLAVSWNALPPGPFRQSQTAITSYWMLKEGYQLAYQTPSTGYPWSVPFEFPIYQAMVAEFTRLTGMALYPAGRLVSWVFMLLSLWPMAGCLRLAGQDRRAFPLVAAFYLVTPVYLFWGSDFMMESTALFFSLGFLYYALQAILHRATLLNIALALLLLMLALLQKSTTVLPLLPVLFGLFGWRWYQGQRPSALLLLLWPLMAVTILLYSQWVSFTDAVKEQSLIGHYITSKALLAWNFGTLRQRLSWSLWGNVLLVRIALPFFLWVPVWLSVRRRIYAQDRRLGAALLFLLAAVISPLLTFTNLHICHVYYQYSVTIYFGVAVGLAVAWLVQNPQKPRDQRLPVQVFVCLLLFNLGPIKDRFIDYNMDIRRTTALGDYLRQATPPEQPVIIFGNDWSSDIAYYAERKAATVPDWDNLVRRATDHPEDFVKTRPSAYVVCDDPDRAYVQKQLPQHGFHMTAVIFGCYIYQPVAG